MSWCSMIDYRWLNANTGRVIPNIASASLRATLQAAAHKWMAVIDVKDISSWLHFRHWRNHIPGFSIEQDHCMH